MVLPTSHSGEFAPGCWVELGGYVLVIASCKRRIANRHPGRIGRLSVKKKDLPSVFRQSGVTVNVTVSEYVPLCIFARLAAQTEILKFSLPTQSDKGLG